MRTLHLTNDKKRDARVGYEAVREPDPPRVGLPGKRIEFRRFIASTEAGLHDALSRELGADYSQQLVDGDPEIDMEVVGIALGRTDTVYLTSEQEVMYVSPEVVEVILDTEGKEKDRRPAQSVPSNVDIDEPVRWTGRAMPIAKVVRNFAFRRCVQVQHVDGLTYDFCYEMAKTLHDAQEMVLLGAGPKGNGPLIFSENGRPYRGFLSGRVDGRKYQLLVNLTDLELKVPA